MLSFSRDIQDTDDPYFCGDQLYLTTKSSSIRPLHGIHVSEGHPRRSCSSWHSRLAQGLPSGTRPLMLSIPWVGDTILLPMLPHTCIFLKIADNPLDSFSMEMYSNTNPAFPFRNQCSTHAPKELNDVLSRKNRHVPTPGTDGIWICAYPSLYSPLSISLACTF